MIPKARLVLFGDQTANPRPLIRDINQKSSKSPILHDFFERTAIGLRQELSHAEAADRAAFPSFNTIPGLVEGYSQEFGNNVAVDTVLLCIYQLSLILM